MSGRWRMPVVRLALPAMLGLLAASASAQIGSSRSTQDEQADENQPQPQPTSVRPVVPGRVADSAVGQVGQRQTSGQLAPNAQPMDRIASRVQNRVQSRLRTRIDRNYDPQANTISPFEVAADQARIGGPIR